MIFSQLLREDTDVWRPLILTDFGKDISEKLDAISWASKTAGKV